MDDVKAEKAFPSRDYTPKLPESKDFICPAHHYFLIPSQGLPLSGNQVLGGRRKKREGKRHAYIPHP